MGGGEEQEGEITKGASGNFAVREVGCEIHYLDYSDGFTSVCANVPKLIKLCTLRHVQLILCQLYLKSLFKNNAMERNSPILAIVYQYINKTSSDCRLINDTLLYPFLNFPK